MKLKKMLQSLTSFDTIFALTTDIIITYAPAGAEDLTVDDIKDRIEQIKQDNAQRRLWKSCEDSGRDAAFIARTVGTG